MLFLIHNLNLARESRNYDRVACVEFNSLNKLNNEFITHHSRVLGIYQSSSVKGIMQ